MNHEFDPAEPVGIPDAEPVMDVEPAAPPPVLRPVSRTERLASIDFARGLALLGIYFVNAAFFFGPISSGLGAETLAKLPPVDRVASLLVLSLFSTKFISIFSTLFGYGLYGQMERAMAAGRSKAGFTFRRLGIMALFGACHALLLWYGDVLFIYAIMGGWLLLAPRRKTRTLVIITVILMLITLAGRAGFERLAIERGPRSEPPAEATPPASAMEAMKRSQFNINSRMWIDAEARAYREGPWRDMQVFRMFCWFLSLVTLPGYTAWLTLGMFYQGAVLYRLRFFSPEKASLRWRVFTICLPLGVVFEAVAAWFFWNTGPGDRAIFGIGHVIQQAGLFFLPLGYLSGFALLADALPGKARDFIACGGRMSLSVYLSETICATAISYYWGLGQYGKIGEALQLPIVFGIWFVLIVLSNLWLRRFEQGPMEWLWRRLEYGRSSTASMESSVKNA